MEIIFTSHPNFKPNYTPIEMFKLGIFGGNYFGNLEVKQNWELFVPNQFLNELKATINPKYYLNPYYSDDINKFAGFCGSNYSAWIAGGWIKNQDPFGWVNWYINFYYGRRSDDDERQINRFLSFKARHGGMFKRHPNSKKTMQNMLHWAIDYKTL